MSTHRFIHSSSILRGISILALIAGIVMTGVSNAAPPPPPGDACSSAIPINAFPFSVLRLNTTMGYANNYAPPLAGVDGPDVVFVVPPPAAASILRFTTSFSSSPSGTAITVYRGMCASGAPVAFTQQPGLNTASLTINAVTGQPYFIVVETGGTGALSLNFFAYSLPAVPQGDACGNPFPVASIPYAVENLDIQNFADDITVPGNPNNGIDAVWTLPAIPAGTVITADTLGSSFDTILAVINGSCPGGTVVGINTYGDGNANQSVVTWTAQAGATYYVVIEGRNGNTGKLNLHINGSGPPAQFPVFDQPLQQLGLGDVAAADYSPDGSLLATAGDGGIVVWDTQTGGRLRTVSDTASDVAFSPDGRYMAYGYTTTTEIHDAETGELIRTLTHDNLTTAPQHIAFSPDGQYLAVAFELQPWARLWDWQTGTLIRQLGQALGTSVAGATCIAFTPDSQNVVTGHASVTTGSPQLNRMAALWNVSTGALVRSYSGHTERIHSVAVSPDGTQILTSSGDGTARQWNLSTGAQIRSISGAVHCNSVPAGGGGVHYADYSPDGTTLVLGNATAIDFWNASTGTCVTSSVLEDVRFVRYNPAGDEVVVIQRNLFTAGIWNVGTQTVRMALSGYTGAMVAAAGRSGGTEIWTSHAAGKAHQWDVSTGVIEQTVSVGAASNRILGMSPGGDRLIYANLTAVPYSLVTLDTATGTDMDVYAQPYTDFLASPNSNNVTVSADGARIAAGGLGRIIIWDAGSMAIIREITFAMGVDIQLVSLSPNGTRIFCFLAGAPDPMPGRVYNVQTGALVSSFAHLPLDGSNSFILSAAWSPDGGTLATGDSVGNMRLWNPATGASLLRMVGDPGFDAQPIEYSSDGRFILVGSELGGVRMFRASNGEQLELLSQPNVGFANRVLSLAFLDGWNRMVAGHADGRTFVWELDPPRALIVAAGDPDPNNNALTVQTKSLAAYAGSVCLKRDYPEQDVRILSSFVDPPFNAPIDADGDGSDDTYASTTVANLRANLIDWMNESSFFGRRLLLYMSDHGLREAGETHFILNACETISATELDALLDELQDPMQNGGLKHEVTLVVDCCYSGQFVTTCNPTFGQKRTVIGSTQSEALAVFLPAPDLTSFSHEFFGAAYMGASLKSSFEATKSFFQFFPIADQIPQLVDDTGPGGTGTASGFVGRSWIYAGSGSGFESLAELGTASVTPGGILSPNTVVTLAVDVTSSAAPEAVFAQVLPPAPDTLSGNPVTDLPLVTLVESPVGSGHWVGNYTVTEEGTYAFGIYGRYEGARRSESEVVFASVNEIDPEESRPLVAVLAAGQEDPVSQTGALDDQAIELTARAYITAEERQYPAAQMRVLGPSVLTSHGTSIPQAATNANFASALSAVVSGQPGARLFVSLIGPVDASSDFQLMPGETISPAQLDALLDPLQIADPNLEIVVLIDSPRAGRYESALDQTGRFLTLGTTDTGDGFFLPDPTYQSFSRRFLEASRQGRDVYDSYIAGLDFATLFSLPAPILTDGTGQPIPTGAVGKYLGRRGVFASDAGELATICNVAPDQDPVTLNAVQIYVDFQDGLQPDEVTAQVVPSPPTGLVSDVRTVTLTHSAPGSSRWYLPAAEVANLFSEGGDWVVSYEASYATAELIPRQSQARITRIGLIDEADIYEGDPYEDDASGSTLNVLTDRNPQFHTLHHSADQDWGRVYQLADAAPVPFSLRFDNLVLPAGMVLQVDLFENGPTNAATATLTILSTDTTRDLQWLGTGVREIYFWVRILSGASTSTPEYNVTFLQNTGANNGIASTIGARSLNTQWTTVGGAAGADGFTLKRSTTGAPGSYAPVNATPIPLPGSFGSCPGPGCVEQLDGGLEPLTIYFYQVDLETSSGSSTWTPPFYGYTGAETASPTPTATPTPSATPTATPMNAVTDWQDYE